jgi:predicted metal-dependent phosphoesterase TrpH
MTLRIAAHVHSTWSYDGRWALEDLARAFAKRGYGAVLMAEHDRTFDSDRWRAYRAACAQASAHGALLVPGIEYSDRDNRVHIPVWGAEDFLGAGRPPQELLADARAAGAFAMIAHPGRRDAWRALPEESFALAHGVEVWNRKYDGWAASAVGLELAARHGLAPFVGLDFHTARQFFALAMCDPAPAPELSEDAVLVALRAMSLVPTAFTLPARRLTTGAGLNAARAGEFARRRLAKALRPARRLASR